MIKIGNKKDGLTNFLCTIRLLDDNDVLDCEFQSFHKGRYLFDYIFNRLNLVETDYFGLRFIDQHKQRHWLDPNKNILRQIKSLNPIIFCFRVKFYPADPLKLHEEITRYYLFLQLRRDLLHGRLYCTQSDAATLGAYIIQAADLGDEKSSQDSSYVNDYKILLKQTPKVEEKIAEIHKTLKGVTQATAEIYFLKKSASIDTYGIDPYSVKDHRGVHLYLGLSHAGILTFLGAKKTHHFRWSEIQKLNYEGKMFIIHLVFMEDSRTKRKETVGFKCSSASSCRNLWRAAVEQRLFYTMDRSNKQGVVVTGGSFFSRGSRFRYQGRCEREVVEESASIERDPPIVNRVPLKNVGRSTSLPSTPADSDNYESIMSRVHRPLPYIDRSTSLDEEVLCGPDSPIPAHDHYTNGSFAAALGKGGAYCPEATLPPLGQLEPLVEDNENKYHQNSLPDGAFSDADNHSGDHGYFEKSSQSFGISAGKVNVKNSFREASDTHKRLFRHPVIKDDDYIPPPSICECNDLLQDDYERDTSSTETLGPPTEPLDVPFAPQPGREHTSTYRNTRSTPSLPLYDSDLKDSQQERSMAIIPSSRLALWKTNVNRFLPNLYRFSQVFFITLVFVIMTLGLLIILIFESDLAYLEALRSSTELVLLRVQYYEPLRNFVLRSSNKR